MSQGLGDPAFVSLGMVVIDELRFPAKEPLNDVPGGSGIYATFGARLLRTGSRSPSIGCIVLAGHDFPEKVLSLLQEWDMSLVVCKMSDQPSTRGLLVYDDDAFGRKSFAYTTPPLQPRPCHLESSGLLRAKSFHILAPPEDLERQVSELLDLRKRNRIIDRPLIVWEPAPLGCDRSHLDAHLRACRFVDVFSPNHLELSYLVDGKQGEEPLFDKETIEKLAMRFLNSGIGQEGQEGHGLAVIRAGEHGVLILTSSGPEWLPPFYAEPSSKIVDPTGAGNAFLGAFCVSLQETGDPREAAICGSVAASFALEQFGPPLLSSEPTSSEETWNGVDPATRLRDFRKRVSSN